MKVVQPIRDLDMLNRCYEIAREHDAARGEDCPLSWELLFAVGCNTALRISDLSRLRVEDVRGKEYVNCIAQKTGKDTRIFINKPTQRVIKRLTAGRGADEWLFQSRQRDGRTGQPKHITRQRAWQIISRVAREAGIEERIGCHTLRKTYGYHHYKAYGDVVKLQRILGHDSTRDTLVYIGIIDDEVADTMRGMSLVYDERRARHGA